MKEIRFSRNSFGFKLLCWYDRNYKYYPPADICAFGRAFAWQTLKHLSWLALGCAVLGFLGIFGLVSPVGKMFLAKIGFGSWSVFFQIPFVLLFGVVDGAIVMAIMAVFIGISWTIGKVKDLLIDWVTDGSAPKKKPGPILEAYKAFKEKTCYKIKFD